MSREKFLQKTRLAILLSTILIISLTSTIVLGINEAPESPGPAPDSGNGVPSSNQYIRPDSPGMGPAPNSGDGDPDDSGFIEYVNRKYFRYLFFIILIPWFFFITIWRICVFVFIFRTRFNFGIILRTTFSAI